MRVTVRTFATVCLVIALGALGGAWLLATPPGVQPAAEPVVSTGSGPQITADKVRTLKVALKWDPTTSKDVAGYRVSWGDRPGRYTESQSVSAEASAVDLELPLRPEPYFIAIQATNGAGQMSEYSNEFALDVSSGKAQSLDPAQAAQMAKRSRATKPNKPKQPKPKKEKKPKKDKKRKKAPAPTTPP